MKEIMMGSALMKSSTFLTAKSKISDAPIITSDKLNLVFLIRTLYRADSPLRDRILVKLDWAA